MPRRIDWNARGQTAYTSGLGLSDSPPGRRRRRQWLTGWNQARADDMHRQRADADGREWQELLARMEPLLGSMPRVTAGWTATELDAESDGVDGTERDRLKALADTYRRHALTATETTEDTHTYGPPTPRPRMTPRTEDIEPPFAPIDIPAVDY